MTDAESEIARAKWLMGFLLVFLISGIFAFGELVYLVFGRDGSAKIVSASVETSRGRFGTQSTRLAVDYTFKEGDGTLRRGSDKVSPEWEFAESPDGGVAIRYTPGKDGRSRLAGNVNWAVQLLFFGSLAVVGVFAYRFWREVNEAVSEKPKGK